MFWDCCSSNVKFSFIVMGVWCSSSILWKNKKSNTGENISQDKPEGNPLRNMRPPPTLWWSVVVIWWFQSHGLYCLSVIYPLDIHSLINVLSDLLKLFSFLLTVILFPLDKPDSVLCALECMCMCRLSGHVCLFICWQKKKKKKFNKQGDKVCPPITAHY